MRRCEDSTNQVRYATGIYWAVTSAAATSRAMVARRVLFAKFKYQCIYLFICLFELCYMIIRQTMMLSSNCGRKVDSHLAGRKWLEPPVKRSDGASVPGVENNSHRRFCVAEDVTDPQMLC